LDRSEDEKSPRELIVSSAHLAAGNSPALSELEYGMIRLSHALDRWTARCMSAAGVPGLSPVEIIIIRTLCDGDEPKTLSDLCSALHIEERHIARYAVRKLEIAGLVKTGRSGREKVIRTTDKARKALVAYFEIRERLLVGPVKAFDLSHEDLHSTLASHMRAMCRYYEQAARSASTL
jgi:predicted MarR family transcription regulator